jgi:HEAT repeat protein
MTDKRTWLAIGSCVAVAAAAAGVSVLLAPDRPGAPSASPPLPAQARGPEAPRSPSPSADSSERSAGDPRIPPSPSPAHADLARRLFSEGVEERQRAIGEIQVFEGPKEFFVPLLVRSLEDGEPVIRKGAIRALSSIGGSASGASSSLLSHAVGDPDESVRVQAVFGLAAVQPPADILLEALESGQPRRQWAVLVAIRESPPKEPGGLVQVLVRLLLEHPDREIRCLSVQALCALGPDAGGAVETLRSMWQRGDSDLRNEALQAHSRIMHGVSLHELMDTLASGGNLESDAVVRYSRWLQQEAAALVPLLLEQPGRGGCRARGFERVMVLLGRSAVPHLVRILEGRNEKLLNRAILALQAIGPEAEEAIEPIRRCIDGGQCPTEAILALGAIGKPAVSALIRVLNSCDDELRLEAIAALDGIGPPAQEALPFLSNLCLSTSPAIRAAAGQAVRSVSGEKEPSLASGEK